MKRRDAGFTLLEVVVALAILSLAVVAAIQGFAQGLRLLKLAGDHQRAMLLADEKAREVLEPDEGREQVGVQTQGRVRPAGPDAELMNVFGFGGPGGSLQVPADRVQPAGQGTGGHVHRPVVRGHVRQPLGHAGIIAGPAGQGERSRRGTGTRRSPVTGIA